MLGGLTIAKRDWSPAFSPPQYMEVLNARQQQPHQREVWTYILDGDNIRRTLEVLNC